MVRITVVYEDSRLNLDLNPADSIAVIKKAVREKMVVETVEDKKVAKYLEVTYSGNEKSVCSFQIINHF